MKRLMNSIAPERIPFFYGYIIAIVGTIGIWASIPGQTVGVSTFTDPVRDALNLTRDKFSLAYMIGTLMSSLVLTYAGKLYDRYGAIISAASSVSLLIITLLLCSFSQQISEAVQTIFGFQHWVFPFILMIILFFMLRLSGQGVLTMTSRNMVMKWFDKMRGRINAFSSVSVSLGFSASPIFIDQLIQKHGWQGAWQVMALGLVGVLLMIFFFYKDRPEQFGLHPDGVANNEDKDVDSANIDQYFTLPEALQTRSFWMYSLALAFHAFFVTGLTFHVVSLFAEAGLSRSEAISIFIPMTVVSVSISILANFISDWINLKIILFVMLFGALAASVGLLLIQHSTGIYLIIAGLGVTGGLFAVINAIAWPRFFGRKHLGAISGKAMSMIVMASAIGPYLFSFAKTYTFTYASVAYISIVFLIGMFIASIKANTPSKSEL